MNPTHPKTEWREIRGKCPACGHRRFCTTSADGSVVLCRRNPAGKPVQQKDTTTAWLFNSGEMGGAPALPGKPKAETKKLTTAEVTAKLKQFRTAVNPQRLERLSKSLGLTVYSLKAYGIGWDDVTGAWSFPMYDGTTDSKGRPKPCGIRLRRDDGRKLCVVGSRNGLFLPADFVDSCRPIPEEILSSPDNSAPLLLLLPEGPTDAAAALDLGFRAIGRPNNNGGADQLERLLTRCPPQEVAIVGDRDEPKYLPNGIPQWPGIEGALTIAKAVWKLCRPCRYMLPPDGYKDIRDWLKVGTPGAMLAAVMTAPVVNADWIKRAEMKLDKNREAGRRPTAA